MPKLNEDTRRRLRDEIEDAALDLFVERGYAATSTRDIARACGLTTGALYNHYRSKKALFAAVVKSYKKRIAIDHNPVVERLQRSRFPDDLPDLAFAIRDLIKQHRRYWLLWYVDVVEFGGSHFRDALEFNRLMERPAVKERLAEIGEADRLRVEPEFAFVMSYMHFFNYFLVEILFRGRGHYGMPADRAVGKIADVLMRGFMR